MYIHALLLVSAVGSAGVDNVTRCAFIREISLYTCHVTVATEDGEKEAEMLAKFRDFQSKSEMYYVYHAIQRYTVGTTLNVYWGFI